MCVPEGQRSVLYTADFLFSVFTSSPPKNCANSPAGVEGAAICHFDREQECVCVYVCICVCECVCVHSMMPARDLGWM